MASRDPLQGKKKVLDAFSWLWNTPAKLLETYHITPCMGYLPFSKKLSSFQKCLVIFKHQ
jgi:hypothetical protein